MCTRHVVWSILVLFPFLTDAEEAPASGTSGSNARIEHLERTVEDLQKALQSVQEELKQLKAEQAAKPPASPTASFPAPPGPGNSVANFWGGGGGSRVAGPAFDFGIVGNIVGTFHDKGEHDGRSADALSFSESELAFGANIDPYSRADLVISFPDRDTPEIEEGYVTWEAPAAGVDKVILGKSRMPFGKLNPMHAHNLPQTDYPLVIKKFFGDEGLKDTGASVLHTFDLGFFSQVSYTLANGDNATAFDNRHQSDPMHLLHWKNFWDVGEQGGLELGFSGAYGAQDRRERNAARYGGADLAYKWKEGKDRSFRLGTEAVWMSRQRQTASPDVPDVNVSDSDEAKFGMYSFAEVQWSQRWAAGARYDYVEVPGMERDKLWAVSPYLTFYQSEFNRLRLELSHQERLGADDIGHFFQNRDSNSVSLQWNFILGTHRPHPF